MFVTGRGGAGFHLSGPPLTRSQGGYFSGNPRPAPVRGPPTLIPWTVLFVTTDFGWGPVWGMSGAGASGGTGAGNAEKDTRPLAVERGGAGKMGGGPGFSGLRPPCNEL